MTTRILLAACLILVSIGCGGGGDAAKRQPVTGTVNFRGKPIQFGSVRFEPAAGQIAPASADIRDGKFTLARAQGPSPGKYKVWVQAFDRVSDSNAMPGSEGPAPKDILPAKYLNEPALETDILEVGDSAPNTLTIDLK